MLPLVLLVLVPVVLVGGLVGAVPSHGRPVSTSSPSAPLSVSIVEVRHCLVGVDICETSLTVEFAAEVSGGTPPYAIFWTFGDGTAGFGQDVNHTYSGCSEYTVAVLAVSLAGTASNSTGVSLFCLV